MKEMTAALQEYLSKCPTGKWFEIDDVMVKIPRTRYNLDRLVQFGKLARKVVDSPAYKHAPTAGTIHTLKYKVISKTQTQEQ